MPLRSSRLSKLSFYIIISSLILLFLILIFLVIVYFYPIPTVTANFNTAHYSRLLAPWPMSSLEQELLERRRLRRYAKGEQIRRMEKQLQRMENLNIPIYDLFLDNNAEISNSHYITSPDDTSFLWPILPAKKLFYNQSNPNLIRKSSYVIFPYNFWSQINEGVLLLGGEEIKATIPMVRGRRSFSFNLFLLTPGSIRISLGQYVWAKSFTDDDVQKRIKLTIPINDSTASIVKIISISSSFYLLNANVNHLEHSGRSPIMVSSTSQFWSVNKSLVISAPKKEIVKSDENTSNVEEPEEEKFPEEIKPEEVKPDELLPQVKTSPKAALKKTNENFIDPLKQITNQQVITNESVTTAFGYNILFIQTPKIPESIIKNKKLFVKIAPALSTLMDESLVFSKAISISENSSENFRKFIYSDKNYYTSDNISIAKEEVNENKQKNIYHELRKYGYNVVGISYPEAFYYNKNISETSEFPSIYGRWLEKNDWTFASKNIKIDDRNIPISGLDAIFKTSAKGIAPPLTQKDFPIISNFLTGIAQNLDNVPDWSPNEYILINDRELYIPRVVETFQHWTKENQQSRFLAHILLDTDQSLIRPTVKDLGKSLLTLGFSSILNPSQINDFANLSYLDKSIGQILDTLKARKIENRTIVFILVPLDKKDGKKVNVATGIYKIPGLIPKKNIHFENININDITATLLTNIGIPAGKNMNTNNKEILGYMLEKLKYKDYKSFELSDTQFKNNFIKYSMLIKPNEKNCAPFQWNAKFEPVFSIKSSAPIYQIISDNIIEIFPCSIKNKFITLNWYQKNSLAYSAPLNVNDFLGGNFTYKLENNLLPNFYFGRNILAYDNISFYFDSINSQYFNEIFSVEEKNTKKCLKSIKDNFLAVDTLENKNIEDKNLSKKTKIGFFITPL